PPADVIDASPVDELVAPASRDQHVARARAVQRGPQPPQRVRIDAAAEHAVGPLELQRSERAIDVPPGSVRVSLAHTRAEAQLAALAPHACLLSVAPGQDLDALDLAKPSQHLARQCGATHVAQ